MHGTISAETKDVENLIALANEAFAVDASALALFVEKVGLYLEHLESWRARVERFDPPLEKLLQNSSPQNSGASDEFRKQCSELHRVHQQIIERAALLKGNVSDEMKGLRKKATALKAYVDRFPKRITIAGKREG